MHINLDQDTRVRIGGIIAGETEDDDVFWALEAIDGLYDTTLLSETGTMSWADGGWAGPAWIGAKNLALKLAVRVPPWEPEKVGQTIARMKQTLPIRDLAPMAIKTYDGVFICQVRCVDKISIEPYRTGAKITIPLYCPDPVLYAADWDSGGVAWREWSTGLPARRGGLTFPFRFPFVFGGVEEAGAIEFVVSGSAGARGIIEITGPAFNIVVQDTQAGWRFAYGQALGEGETLKVDPYRRLVEVNGASRRGQFSGDWPEFAPGAHRVTWSATASPDTQPLLKVRIADIYQ